MKKLILILLIAFALSPIVYYCFIKYAFWQSIAISEIGVFKVPQNWIVTQKGKYLYITDKPIEKEGYSIYLIGVIRGEDDKRSYYDFYDFDFFENVEYIGTASFGMLYSNSARYWIEKYNINGIIEEKYVLEFRYSGQSIYLLVWDTLINHNTIIKIVKSFRTA